MTNPPRLDSGELRQYITRFLELMRGRGNPGAQRIRLTSESYPETLTGWRQFLEQWGLWKPEIIVPTTTGWDVGEANWWGWHNNRRTAYWLLTIEGDVYLTNSGSSNSGWSTDRAYQLGGVFSDPKYPPIKLRNWDPPRFTYSIDISDSFERYLPYELNQKLEYYNLPQMTVPRY
jgi:hypothetical protein